MHLGKGSALKYVELKVRMPEDNVVNSGDGRGVRLKALPLYYYTATIASGRLRSAT